MDPNNNNNNNKPGTASRTIDSTARRQKYYTTKIKELTELQNQAYKAIAQYSNHREWDPEDQTITHYHGDLTPLEQMDFDVWIKMLSDLTIAKGRIMGFKQYL